MASVRPMALEKALSLTLDGQESLPPSLVNDSRLFRQCLLNILANAVKFTERGVIKISAQNNGEHLEIRVEDTGIGITAEDAAKLFTPFFQASSSNNRRYGGTGLGLTLSRQIAAAMGGELKLEKSQLGSGSTFLLSLPVGKLGQISLEARSSLAPQKLEAHSTAATPFKFRSLGKRKPLVGLRILVAEDSEDLRLLFVQTLQNRGAEVEACTNGQEAVVTALARNFDIVLMDVQMPEMDGYHATATLRSLKYPKPILALTAHAMSAEQNNCRDAGFSAYLSKPVSSHALVEKVLTLTQKDHK